MKKIYPVAGMVALSAVTTACQQADKQEKKQYNIVYIMTDDHTAQMMYTILYCFFSCLSAC